MTKSYNRTEGKYYNPVITLDSVNTENATIGWPAGAEAFKTQSQNPSGGGSAQINWDDKRGDTGDNWDLANDKFVIPSDGDYTVYYCVNISSLGTGLINFFVALNGATVIAPEYDFASQPYNALTLSEGRTLEGLSAGDELTLSVFVENGLTVEAESSATYMGVSQDG